MTLKSNPKGSKNIDRNGSFIFEGNTVKPLSKGLYKGQEIKFIQIFDNRLSLNLYNDKQCKPS